MLKDKKMHRYDVAAGPLSKLQPGGPVCIILPGCSIWTHGRCKQQVAPHFYDIMIDNTVYYHNHYYICCDNTSQSCDMSIEYIDPESIPAHPVLHSLPAKYSTPVCDRELWLQSLVHHLLKNYQNLIPLCLYKQLL